LFTVIVAERLVAPLAPVQVSVYVPLPVRLLSVSLSVVAFAPFQLPLALHAVVLLLDQLSVLDAPLATVDGLAVSVSVGAGPPGPGVSWVPPLLLLFVPLVQAPSSTSSATPWARHAGLYDLFTMPAAQRGSTAHTGAAR
jgi:hypothetical protein